MQRSIFYISDGTGISAEVLGNSLLTQFDTIEFSATTLPFINSADKAENAVQKINEAYMCDGVKPIVFTTLVEPKLQKIIAQSHALVMDFFHAFITPLELELNIQSNHSAGRSHSIYDQQKYNERINAIDFSMVCDDGLGTQKYKQADVILIGASRTGKTPTSVYLALQYGILVANYPLTEECLSHIELPREIRPFKEKLFGLSIEATRLQAIRQQRLPNSDYSSLRQCEKEVKQIETLFQQLNIPYINTTIKSIEEIATKIILEMKLKRRVF